MNKIIINHGSFKVNEVELEHGTLTVGRAADNDLKLDDSAVSSHHAKLVTFFNVTYIEDLNSTNGTLVNGRPVKKYTLHTGDIVLLGKHQLLFQGSRLEQGQSDSTMVMTANDKNEAMANAAEMRKPTSKPVAPSPHRPAKIPMKQQEHSETVGQLHEEPAMSEGPAASMHVRQEASPFRHEAPAAPHTPAAASQQQQAAPMAKRPFASEPINEAFAKPAFGNASHSGEALTTTNDDALAANTTATQPESAKAKPNPFQAAFPEDSADRIDVNSVPSIGNLETTGSKAQSDNPDDSSADIYNVQALSLAAEKQQQTEQKPVNFADIPVDNDESLLIPAFAKKPPAAVDKEGASISSLNQRAEQKISPEIEKLFAEEEKIKKSAPVRKVLEDPSVNMGEEAHAMTPVGLNESNRINQYQQRAAASHGDIPAVGDRTLLKQIITGDRDFSPSRNKFEIIQIVLGVVIFVIIALIAVASM